MFKKGDKVTRIASWDSTGTVYVTHFVVSSWGKRQATLVKVDDSTNAKFRVYTDPRYSQIQGIHSSKIIATAEYSDAVALQFAVDCVADENRRAIERMNRAIDRNDSNLEHERGVFARHNAVAWTAKVRQP